MTDWVILNPSEEELDRLHEAGFTSTEVTNPAEVFQEESGAEKAILLPFYYGFHVGLEVPEDDVYRMLQIIEENAAELARPMPPSPRSRRTWPACRCAASRRRRTSCRSIRASPGTCARRASGTRNGIPGSQRNSSGVRRTGARAGQAAPARRAGHSIATSG